MKIILCCRPNQILKIIINCSLCPGTVCWNCVVYKMKRAVLTDPGQLCSFALGVWALLAHCPVCYVGWNCSLFRLVSQSGIYGGAGKAFFPPDAFFTVMHCRVELLPSECRQLLPHGLTFYLYISVTKIRKSRVSSVATVMQRQSLLTCCFKSCVNQDQVNQV